MPETLEYARYVIVFTTFPESEFHAAAVLRWYRLRWQVELVFKRFKSLAGLGHLLKRDSDSAWSPRACAKPAPIALTPSDALVTAFESN